MIAVGTWPQEPAFATARRAGCALLVIFALIAPVAAVLPPPFAHEGYVGEGPRVFGPGGPLVTSGSSVFATTDSASPGLLPSAAPSAAWAPVNTSGPSPSPRTFPSMTYDPVAGGLLLFGGLENDTGLTPNATLGIPCPRSLGDTWLLQGSQWTNLTGTLPLSPPARSNAMMAWDPMAQAVVLFGGLQFSQAPNPACADQPQTYLNDTWEWSAGRWTQLLPSMSPPARAYGAMASDPNDGGVLLFGGTRPGGTATLAGLTSVLNDTWLLSNGSWTLVRSKNGVSPPALSGAALAYDSLDGLLVLYGGTPGGPYGLLGGAASNSNLTWAFDRGNWTWEYSAQLPGLPNTGAWEMSGTPDGRVILVLGGSTWAFSNGTWGYLSPSLGSPTPEISGAAMVPDPSLNATILVGGTDAGSFPTDPSVCYPPPPSTPGVCLSFSTRAWALASPLPSPSPSTLFPALEVQVPPAGGAAPANLTVRLRAIDGTPPYAWNVGPVWDGGANPEGAGSLTGGGWANSTPSWNGSEIVAGSLALPIAGNWTIYGEVRDSEGRVTVTAVNTLVLGPPKCEATFTGLNGYAPYTIRTTILPYAGFPPYRSLVDWGDGNVTAPAVTGGYVDSSYSLSHTYPTPGNYTIRVALTDSAGTQVMIPVATVIVRPAPLVGLGLAFSPLDPLLFGIGLAASVSSMEARRRQRQRRMEAAELVTWLETAPSDALDEAGP